MTETGKIMQAVDSVEHDLKHCGYLRKEATEQYLPTLISAAKAQFAEARLLEGTEQKTLARPNAAGWWWTRPQANCLWRIVEITLGDDGKIWIQEMGDEEPDLLGDLPWWEWAGPMTQPVPSNE
jgi:hypothetical protein